jgi:hypothetical protein
VNGMRLTTLGVAEWWAAQYWLRARLHWMPFKHNAFHRQRIPPARFVYQQAEPL